MGDAAEPALLVWGEHAAGLLRTVRVRRTPGRIAMIAALLDARLRHLSVAEIEQRLREAGWRSDATGIHRAMATFTNLGLVHTLPAAGHVAFGMATPAHHHAICMGCGITIEIPVAVLGPVVNSAGGALSALDFRLAPDGLALRGRCSTCNTPAI